MCIAAGDILYETRQQYVGLAHTAISDVSSASRSPLWYYIANGGAFVEYDVFQRVLAYES